MLPRGYMYDGKLMLPGRKSGGGGATTLPRGYDTCRTHRIRQTRGKKQKHKTPKEHNRGLTRKKWYRAKKARVHGYFVSALDDTVGRCDPPALEVAGRPRT